MQLEFLFSRKKETRAPDGDSRADAKAEKAADAGDRELTGRCSVLLNQLGIEKLADAVRVEWNPRMRTTAGRAFWPDALIQMNPVLREIAPEEVERTLLHELAHLVAYSRAGRRRIAAHGVEWKRACADLGIPGERVTHSLPLPGRRMRRKWRYACPACGEGFDRVRKMKRAAGCYACCKAYNGGYYHRKFRLVESQLDTGSD